MSRPRTLYRLRHSLLIVTLLLSTITPAALAQDNIYLPLIANGQPGSIRPVTNLLFRTQVSVNTPAQWQELAALGVVTLARGDDWALLLVDDQQLETLARLRYTPQQTNALETLATAHTAVSTAAAALLPQLPALQAELTAASLSTEATAQRVALRQSLRTAMHALSSAQRATLAQVAAVDGDNDGLTDDEEVWWCTDAAKADSDFDGTKDGAEVAALDAWLNNQRTTFPSTGKPFQGWPPQKANCYDDDQDAVPDLAESLYLGLNPNRESTDRDKFDDGQELFGLTYCTGQGGFCSYGPLPRNEDWGVIFAEMPSWVKAPGNHPLVAAFPVPEVDVVASSLKVELVTTITDGETTLTGTEKSYSTTKTEGSSTSIANTETWSSWQEIGLTEYESRVRAAEHGARSDNELSLVDDFEADATMQNCGAAALGVGVGLAGGGAGVANCTNINVGDFSPELEFSGVKNNVENLQNNVSTKLSEFQNSFNNWFDGAFSNNNICVSWSGCGNNVTVNSPEVALQVAQTNATQDRPTSTSQSSFSINVNPTNRLVETVRYQQYYQMAYPVVTVPKSSSSKTSGTSKGGSQTTTTTKYEEHAVTNGEAFLNQESWSKTTAIDSAHAADLTFTYKVRNTGTEYAREIADLVFNLYIGDDPNPAYTYFVATDIGGDGKLHNFMPTEEHPYTSQRIPLSLEQMKAIDLGAPIRIVVEDFTYGIDELFYQDAANAGLLIALEDGTDDGDETIDTYLIPTWGNETVLNVVGRYFPHETDDNDTIVAIWTPEYRSDNPSWCQNGFRPTDQPSKVLWCKHVLSTADWWNVYTDGLGDGSEGFQDTNASPGATALFRFNKDTDLDGFSDRSEVRLGTDPTDATSFPRPELLAGLHQIRSGDDVTATLSLLNTGIYDAYGVEAVMVAPDDSVTIKNNTVGGSGRVKALKQVIVGSRIQLPALTNTPWSGQNDHAVPAVGGYYTGDSDRTYTFTVSCSSGNCTVGSGSWTLNWSDGSGNNGSLDFGTNYQSPNFQAVGNFGVTLALYSGAVSNGESFTLQANTPRDTFQYTINREPYTEPLVIVSYNDPQGNHRFVLPPSAMHLTAPTDNLQAFAGQMRPDIGVELITNEPFDAAHNTQHATRLLVNNPSDATLTDAHLFVEFINISGTVVAEVPTQVTLPPGPTSTTVNFDSRAFDPPYRADQDYIVMGFLTDYQGNILDTAGRPLSSFQADPLPALAAAESTLTWDFGTVAQGTLLQHELAIANQGYGRLYTYLPPTAGVTLTGAGQRTVGAADTGDYHLQLDTLALPVGPYSQTLTLRTSDPDRPALTLSIRGTVEAGTADIPASALQRPLDVAVVVTGPHSQGEWITYTHTLGPDADTLHPVKVYSQDYTKLWGVGKVAAPFGQGTSAAIFGTGADGDKMISGDVLFDAPRSALSQGTIAAGDTTLMLANATGFDVGEEIFLYQVQGSTTGTYEFARIAAVNGNSVTVSEPLAHAYTQSGNNKAQVVVVPNYHNVTVTATGRWRAPNWDGNTGGLLVFRASGEVQIQAGGVVDISAKGFRGGTLNCVGCSSGNQGESYGGLGSKNTQNFYSGGGGGQSDPSPSGGSGDASGGGGGGHGTDGTKGVNGQNTAGGGAGIAVGSADPVHLIFGGGGGAGGAGDNWGRDGGVGGNGGGLALISAETLIVDGTVTTNGQNGGHGEAAGGGGGGAGGAIYLLGGSLQLGSNRIIGAGGAAGTGSDAAGGNGAVGRIFIDYCNTLTGTTSPTAATRQISCYIADQNPAAASTVTAQPTVGFDMFGDGRDGAMPGSGNLDNAHGFAAASVNGTAGSTTLNVTDRHSIARVNPGDVLLIHQTQGTGAGDWELNQAADDVTGSGSFALAKPLEHSYSSSGSNRAQMLRVPQYSTCDVTGTVTPLAAWNGTWGGIFAVMCNSNLNLSGTIHAKNQGFRGGISYNSSEHQGGQTAQAGEGINGPRIWQTTANSNGGGGGQQNSNGGPGGGGGGYASAGSRGTQGGGATPGSGGITVGNASLSRLQLGGAGGGGARAFSNPGGTGGDGGGIAIIYAKVVTVSGSLSVNGSSGASGSRNNPPPEDKYGNSGGGGGGAGGTILINSQTVTLETTYVTANGANGGSPGGGGAGYGGNGGDGRIRIEYCETLTGTTNPPASTQKLDCYTTEQTAPSIFRLSLPESFNDGRTYNVQFGRKLDFSAAGEQVTTLRIPAGMVSSAYLDALVSGLPANATLALDIGNDGSVEFQETIDNNSTNQTANLGAALSSYWQTHGSPLAGTLDVPIKVALSQPGQVLLTNLQIQTVGSQVRQVRLPVENYATFSLDFTVGSAGTVALDIGDDGSIDWSGTATALRRQTGNLASKLNAYLAGKQGDSDVPLRFYVNPEAQVTINGYTATINRTADLVAQQLQIQPGAGVVAATAGAIVAGDEIRVSGTLRNAGNRDSGPLTAAFFAEADGWGDWYVGSAFVENLPAGATTTVETLWNTTGFSGTVPVKVVVNPYGRIPESSYANNSQRATTVVNAFTQGDLNGDRAVNVFDLQRLINMILHETQPDSALYPPGEWDRGDLTNDHQWNVFDLQRLINLILEGNQ